MSLVPNETEQALNRHYDVYAAAREEYRQKIAEQAAEIERLRAALEDVIASGLLHGPTTLSDKVLGIVHAALETPTASAAEKHPVIDITKKYRTRDGREVRIYAIDGVAPYPVHGAIKLADNDWEMVAWRSDGRLGGHSEGDCDLIEVKPRIQREVWVNVYRHDDGGELLEMFDNRNDAEYAAGDARIACVRLTIDCEEGEGL